jgi:hypothetical protein
MIRMIVITRFINDQISTGNALTGVIASLAHFSSVTIQFPINGMFVLSFIPLHSFEALA